MNINTNLLNFGIFRKNQNQQGKYFSNTLRPLKADTVSFKGKFDDVHIHLEWFDGDAKKIVKKLLSPNNATKTISVNDLKILLRYLGYDVPKNNSKTSGAGDDHGIKSKSYPVYYTITGRDKEVDDSCVTHLKKALSMLDDTNGELLPQPKGGNNNISITPEFVEEFKKMTAEYNCNGDNKYRVHLEEHKKQEQQKLETKQAEEIKVQQQQEAKKTKAEKIAYTEQQQQEAMIFGEKLKVIGYIQEAIQEIKTNKESRKELVQNLKEYFDIFEDSLGIYSLYTRKISEIRTEIDSFVKETEDTDTFKIPTRKTNKIAAEFDKFGLDNQIAENFTLDKLKEYEETVEKHYFTVQENYEKLVQHYNSIIDKMTELEAEISTSDIKPDRIKAFSERLQKAKETKPQEMKQLSRKEAVILQYNRLNEAISKLCSEINYIINDFDNVRQILENSNKFPHLNKETFEQGAELIEKGYDVLMKAYNNLNSSRINLSVEDMEKLLSKEDELYQMIDKISKQYIKYGELKQALVKYNEMYANVADIKDKALNEATQDNIEQPSEDKIDEVQNDTVEEIAPTSQNSKIQTSEFDEVEEILYENINKFALQVASAGIRDIANNEIIRSDMEEIVASLIEYDDIKNISDSTTSKDDVKAAIIKLFQNKIYNSDDYRKLKNTITASIYEEIDSQMTNENDKRISLKDLSQKIKEGKIKINSDNVVKLYEKNKKEIETKNVALIKNFLLKHNPELKNCNNLSEIIQNCGDYLVLIGKTNTSEFLRTKILELLFKNLGLDNPLDSAIETASSIKEYRIKKLEQDKKMAQLETLKINFKK